MSLSELFFFHKLEHIIKFRFGFNRLFNSDMAISLAIITNNAYTV